MLMHKLVLLALVLLCAAASCAARTLLQADPSVYPGASPADQATQEEARLTGGFGLVYVLHKVACWRLGMEYCNSGYLHWHHGTRGGLAHCVPKQASLDVSDPSIRRC